MKFRALLSSLMLVVASLGAVGARPQRAAAPPQAPKPTAQLTPAEIEIEPLEIEIYKSAHTLIDWTPRQIHDYPFLRKLRPAGSQDQLPMVLEQVGQAVTLLLHEFPQIACDEQVISEVLSRGSRGTPGVARKFRYIALPRAVGNIQGLEEYRTDLKGNPLDAAHLSDFFLITSNYISTYLYLSPTDQSSSRFRHLGVQSIRGRKCHVLGFAQEPERVRRVGTFRFGGKRVVLLVQGLAWIDPETFHVMRIMTWLLAPRPDIGLEVHTSTVDFYPVRPSGFERVLWLPREVTVFTDYRSIRLRNTHHYSNFKLFRVTSTIKPSE